MNLDLKHLCRSEAVARATGIRIVRFPYGRADINDKASVVRYETSDGFKFDVPFDDITTLDFPVEGKAISFLKWITKEIKRLRQDEIEAQAKEMVPG